MNYVSNSGNIWIVDNMVIYVIQNVFPTMIIFFQQLQEKEILSTGKTSFNPLLTYLSIKRLLNINAYAKDCEQMVSQHPLFCKLNYTPFKTQAKYHLL